MPRFTAQVLRIGNVGICFENCRQGLLRSPFSDFLGSQSECDARYEVRDERALPHRRPLLCDAGVWRLFQLQNGYRFETYARLVHGARALLQADVSADWASGVIRIDPECSPKTLRDAPVSSTFGEVLLLALLNRHQGLYVHAATVLASGTARVLLGKSGAGKTTLSGIARERGALPLSDDRTALRFEHGKLVAYGTPFHGTGKHWAARSAPVSGLFFLNHARRTVARPLPTASASARLAAVTFLPFWSRSDVEEGLRLCERAASSTNSYLLRFRPDSSASEALDVAATASPRQSRGPGRPPSPPP